MLVDTGVISWDSTLRSILGEQFAVEDEWATNHLTLADAVSHRTGMPRHDLVYRANGSAAEVMEGMRHLPMTAEPRIRFQYCNLMFTTLGVVVERLSGLGLGKYLTEMIWGPLEMRSTFLSLEDAKKCGAVLAQGYHWTNLSAGFVPLPLTPVDQVGGAGATISTVLDYAKWVRMFLHHESPLLHRGYAAVLEPRMIMDSVPSYVATDSLYAAGWIRSTYRGQKVVWHNGGLPGFGAMVVFLPESKFGVVVMGNSEAAQTYGSLEIVYSLIDDLLGVPDNERRDWFSE